MTSTPRSDEFPFLRHALRKVSALSLSLVLASCATVRPVPVTLPVPPRPVLTPVTASQVQCLAPDVYSTLVLRERALRTYALELEAIIKAANGKAGK